MLARPALRCLYFNRCGANIWSRFYSQTHYEVLGVPRNASQKEIQQAFLEKSKQLHPDKKMHDGEQHDKFVRLNAAYTCLNRAETRHHYDLTLPQVNDGAPPLYSTSSPKKGLFRVPKRRYYQMALTAAIAGVLAGVLYLVTLDLYQGREQELFLIFKSPEALDDDEKEQTS